MKMFNFVMGFSMEDLRKIRRFINSYGFKDIDEFLSCFNDAELKEFKRKGLLEERNRIDKLLKEEGGTP